MTHEDGTGPFALASFEAGSSMVLVRHPEWRGRNAYPGNIGRIEQVRVETPDQVVQMLLRGEADFVQQIPPARIDEVRKAPGVRLKDAESSLSLFLAFDLASPELRTASVKDRNPFRDRRVRLAVNHAVDSQRIRAALGGFAAPHGLPTVGRTAVAFLEELDHPLPQDPDKARALLIEAGYPDGFSVAFDCPASREPACRAVIPMLAEIGIRLDLRVHPSDEQIRLIRAHALDFYNYGRAEPVDSIYSFRIHFHSQGIYNPGWHDPEVDRLIEMINAEMSTYVRDALIEQVWRRVLADVVYVPFYRHVNLWAMREPFDIPRGVHRRPQFRYARFADTVR